MKNIMVLGGDERSFYLTKRLNEKGFSAFWYAGELFSGEAYIKKENPFPVSEKIEAVVLPLPLSRDGNFLNCKYSSLKIPLSGLERELKGKIIFTPDSSVISGTDYFNVSSITVRNARLTAVGFLKELLISQNEDILNKRALITGFGNVGKAIANILDRNSVAVTVMARSEENRAEAVSLGFDTVGFGEMRNILKSYDFIINTVPADVFSEETAGLMKKGALFFELAGRRHEKFFRETDIYIGCGGMPGKHTPKSAGEIIADYIINKLKE